MSTMNSRWKKGSHLRITSDIVQGAWNRNLHERERAPTELAYCGSFHSNLPDWRQGARIRKSK